MQFLMHPVLGNKTFHNSLKNHQFYFQAFQFNSDYPTASNSRTFSIDQATIYNGVYDPNNIFIHVSQNFFNFASSTIAWLATATFYEARNVNARRKRRYLLNGDTDSNIDPATIYTGVNDPNNILIHVSQNFVNFASSTFAWFVIAAFFDNGGNIQKRRKRSPKTTEEEKAEEGIKSRFSGERLANVFRSFASTAESLDR